ncbi:arsenate reductase ArsC [Massilia arenosa]|uniref:Arsenate reductase ArsC n=1 Tax=Zemynaea arenosa TaxID=2561931 RepID=A0A4Y9RZZ9_9BURK|nr:arsenate reductase ArsC [Massilia arenosa]TFW13356.1 arsenate reductase ArsC [Massilia arenosa]
MSHDRVFNVLFLCTGNSARSIIAEALLNPLGGGKFRAFSAGSQPAGAIHPLALEQIERLRFPADGLRSKGWDEFSTADAPDMDFVITVCDQAAGEGCPRWPGHPVTAHWSFVDPTRAQDDETAVRQAFATVAREIKTRLEMFTNLPLEKLSRMALQAELITIGASRNENGAVTPHESND